MKTKIITLAIIMLAATFSFAAAADDPYCFLKMSQGQKVNIGATTYYTCSHTSCTVCVDSTTKWYAAWTKCEHVCEGTIPLPDVPLALEAKFPFADGGLFTKQSFYMDITTTKVASITLYNHMTNKLTTLCPNCNSYKRSMTFKPGQNDITIRAVKGLEVKEKRITFFIDNRAPRITKTLPTSNSYVNNNFTIFYAEDNLQSISLNYGLPGNYKSVAFSGCESGAKASCYNLVDLSAFNGKQITYNFTITDIANNKYTSRSTKINVDTSAPIITNFYSNLSKNYLTLNISLNEKNLKGIYYYDNGGYKKTLCTSLSKGVCFRKIVLRTGEHSLEFFVLDKAGNSVSKMINVNV